MAEKLLGIVAELGTEQLVGADVLIGPQRRNNVHRVVLAFRRIGTSRPTVVTVYPQPCENTNLFGNCT